MEAADAGPHGLRTVYRFCFGRVKSISLSVKASFLSFLNRPSAFICRFRPKRAAICPFTNKESRHGVRPLSSHSLLFFQMPLL